jgi:hypothetical protein
LILLGICLVAGLPLSVASGIIEHMNGAGFGGLGALGRAELTQLLGALAGVDGSGGDDRSRLELLGLLEDLKAAVAGAQVRVTSAFADSQRRAGDQIRSEALAPGGGGFEAWRVGKGLGAGVGAQIGLARRLSPWQGTRAVNTAATLVGQMPGVLGALSAGVLSERRVQLVVAECQWLTPEARGRVDQALAADLTALGSWGDRVLVRNVRALVCQVDAEAALQRARAAAGGRYVSLSPAPEAMCRLSAVLPLADGVSAYATLCREVAIARAAGDQRGRGQLLADTLVARLTGTDPANGVPVEVQVVMSDAALLCSGPGADDPAQVPGYGTVPAGWARELVLGGTGSNGTEAERAAGDGDGDCRRARVWLRRLYATPQTSTLVAMESRARVFPAGLARFITTRDQGCRTPFCDAPVRHLDHVREHAAGGSTSAGNGQGLCERCNYTKSLPGWAAQTVDPDPHRVRWRTPTGLTYDSTAPPLLPGADDDRTAPEAGTTAPPVTTLETYWPGIEAYPSPIEVLLADRLAG